MTTSTEIATIDSYARASLDERQRYATMIAGAGALLSQSVRAQGAAGVFLMAETGAMLGIHPVAALQGVHIIEGKPTLSANLLAALVRRAGHKLRVTTSGSWKDGSFVARAELIRSDDPDFSFVVEWSKDRAQAAGLVGKRGPWTQYPEAMAKARAMTEVIREGASDVTIIPAYSPEELGASNVDEAGELIVVDETSNRPNVGAEPKAQAPISTPPAATTAEAEEIDWAKAIANASSSDEVRELYKTARAQGLLGVEIKQGRKKVKLGDVLIEVGKALDEAESAGEVEPEEPSDDKPAALADDNVVDAEVVTEEEGGSAPA
jgi:hypothetical protein